MWIKITLLKPFVALHCLASLSCLFNILINHHMCGWTQTCDRHVSSEAVVTAWMAISVAVAIELSHESEVYYGRINMLSRSVIPLAFIRQVGFDQPRIC